MGEFLAPERLRRRRCVFGRRLDRAPWRRPDGRDEILFAAVPEFDFPGDGTFRFLPEHANAMAEGSEVRITAYIYGVLRTRLDAGIALPAHVRFDVERTPIGLVDVHDIRWTDIDAVSATVAAGHVDECWHYGLLKRRRSAGSIMPGRAPVAAEDRGLVRRGRKVAAKAVRIFDAFL